MISRSNNSDNYVSKTLHIFLPSLFLFYTMFYTWSRIVRIAELAKIARTRFPNIPRHFRRLRKGEPEIFEGKYCQRFKEMLFMI